MYKKTILSLLLLLHVSLAITQTNYYISNTGNDGNSGLNETFAWKTITYAVSIESPVSAGDTVFVEAGNYTAENIVIQKNGTVTNPIIIQGYQSIPGDSPSLDYVFGDNLDPFIMPLIDGEDRSTGIGININGASNITINNLQITNFESGIIDHSHLDDLNTVLDNIIIKDIGDTLATYSGRAIELYSSNNTIKNCITINACAQGILIYGDYNWIDNCEVYCDDNSSVQAAMDYYIVVYFGNNNSIQNCYVERIGNLPHGGHGIGVKGDCENNLIKDCISKNLKGEGFYVRHRGSKYNTFNNCRAIGVTEGATGFVVRDGASYNEFNNCAVDSCKRGLMFFDTSEDDGAQYCGRNNNFNNCIITNTELGIDFNDYDQDTDVDSNFFNNCIFYNGQTLINVERNNFDNKMINCIISNYETLKTETGGYSLSFDFNYCDFYHNEFAMPGGVGNINVNPQFTDTTLHNFYLLSTSPCIDAGTAIDAPIFDYEGTTRPKGMGYDIGAYEYLNTTEIFENDFQKMVLYPNPTNGIIYLSEQNLGLEYQIYSEDGKLVKIGRLNENKIDVSALKPGVYIISINDKKTIEFIKQ